jgi:hypothetical protein
VDFVFRDNVGHFPLEFYDVENARISHIQNNVVTETDFAITANIMNGSQVQCRYGALTVAGLRGTKVEYYSDYQVGPVGDVYGATHGDAARPLVILATTIEPALSNRQLGMVMLADPSGWDPLSRGGSADPYLVRWNGSAWVSPL